MNIAVRIPFKHRDDTLYMSITFHFQVRVKVGSHFVRAYVFDSLVELLEAVRDGTLELYGNHDLTQLSPCVSFVVFW